MTRALPTNEAGVAMHHLQLYRGDSYTFSVNVDLDGEPLDLSDYEIVARVKSSGGEIFLLTCIAENNVIQITFMPDVTQNAAWQLARYDVQIKKQSIVKTILCGKINIIRDVA